jgi:hypothetical protein
MLINSILHKDCEVECECSSGMASALRSVTDDSELCDVTFIVGGGKTELGGVKALLALRSTYFRSILYGPTWAESEEGRTELEMADWGAVAFRRMLEYIHCGVTTLTADIVMELMRMADYFHLPELKLKCEGYVSGNITHENAAVLLQQAYAFKAEELYGATMAHIEQVRKTSSWPRNWANFSLLQLYSYRNAWAKSRLVGHPNASLAAAHREGAGGHVLRGARGRGAVCRAGERPAGADRRAAALQRRQGVGGGPRRGPRRGAFRALQCFLERF